MMPAVKFDGASNGMFPNARVLPTTGERLAIVVRETAGAPWRQVEAVLGRPEAIRYADDLTFSEEQRKEAFRTGEWVEWHANERAILPMIGQVWTHKSDRLYIIEGMANLYDSQRYPARVVYRGEDGLLFCKSFMRWYESMTFKADSTPMLHQARRDWWTTDYRKDMSI